MKGEKTMKLEKILGKDGYFDLDSAIRDTVGFAFLYADDIKNGRRNGSLSEFCSDVTSTIMARVDKALENVKGE